MDSTRSCSRSSVWRTSTPMSESRPRSPSELSGLTVAKSRMPGEGRLVGKWGGAEGGRRRGHGVSLVSRQAGPVWVGN